ncbi:methionyl-tRNA synthetase [Tieghemostelium lacteum]|uniref:methionine--tRNA ligase n=1 Tax=Tieghemostelium lacteum TaxID=361077 RepID=A0A151ZC57_TIELA|nr:methionyl-tRNA synthetase [Tieghemostelium lacteum]|eukprot:KYQ91528.1 methionyl-tRNA synthetase [Tieghemostelium lacteum]
MISRLCTNSYKFYLNNFKYYSTNSNNTHYKNNEKLLITTPIFYVNGPPHIGHLYTSLLADSVSRWQRFKGRNVLFMTGTDEHGGKVDEAAKKNGFTNTLEYCDSISNRFKSLFQLSQISNDDYIRTTEPRHKETVSELWKQLESKGFIYKGVYKGWYCSSDESFLTDDQVTEGMSLVTPTNPISKKTMISLESGHSVEWVQEENYMFRMSLFKERVLEWLDQGNKVYPQSYESQIRQMLTNKDGLKDLSISRPVSRIPWGISVPNDPTQTVYVWLDALSNYLTVTGYPKVNPNDPESHWKHACHIIGKDIIKFHSIYWPSFLLAAGYPLPEQILCHSHWTVNREKMSKSRGNVVDPLQAIEKFGLDPLRYFLLKGGGLENDGDYTEHEVNVCLTSDLANTFGNLISRSTSKSLHLTNQWPEVYIPCDKSESLDVELIESMNAMISNTQILFDKGNFKDGIYVIMKFLYKSNAYFNDVKPWTLVPKPQKSIQGDVKRLDQAMYLTMECIRITALLLAPIIPQSMSESLNHLGIPTNMRTIEQLKFGYDYQKHSTPLPNDSLILFKKIITK